MSEYMPGATSLLHSQRKFWCKYKCFQSFQLLVLKQHNVYGCSFCSISFWLGGVSSLQNSVVEGVLCNSIHPSVMNLKCIFSGEVEKVWKRVTILRRKHSSVNNNQQQSNWYSNLQVISQQDKKDIWSGIMHYLLFCKKLLQTKPFT